MSLFESLVRTEKRLDQEITKKKITVEEAHFKKIKKQSTIRLNIYIERTSEERVFVLIGGKVKTEADSAEESAETRPLGSVISKLFVDMIKKDSAKTPLDTLGVSRVSSAAENPPSREEEEQRETLQSEDPNFFEWHSGSTSSNVSEFEIKTKCGSERGTLHLSLFSYSGIFSLCKELADAVGVASGTKPALLLAIWKYIAVQKMRDAGNPKVVVCNEAFQKVFKKSEISFREIVERLEEYLAPLEMIQIEFEIPAGNGARLQSAYDITVEIDPRTKEYAYANKQKIEMLDKKIGDILIRIEKQEEKIRSLESFMKSPKDFITQWILESSKNLHLITDDLYEVNNGFFVQKEVQESVYQLLQNYK